MGLVERDPIDRLQAGEGLGLILPHLQLGSPWVGKGELLPWLGGIIPMGLFNIPGSMQNLESAPTPAAPGSCFPTTTI